MTQMNDALPGHTITFVPPLVVLNLLPIDVNLIVQRPTPQQIGVPCAQYKAVNTVRVPRRSTASCR